MTIVPDRDDEFANDPLVEVARHNGAQMLFQIPKKVLLKIIRLLDDNDRECLRRTSRAFLRLVPKAIPDRYEHQSASLWPQPRL